MANATGEVVLLPDLNGVQGVAFERPTVVLAQVRRHEEEYVLGLGFRV